MSLSMKRIRAILMKDYKEFSRNTAVSIVMIMPPLLAFLYGKAGDNTIDTYYLIFNMTFAMVATYVQSCLIAEEKENDTLRALMLSPANANEILLGKSILTFCITGVTLALSMLFIDYTSQHMGLIVLAMAITTVFYISLGTFIGLFAKSVMEASVYSFPVIGIFAAGSFVRFLSEKYPILQAFHYLPNIQLIELATEIEAGGKFMDVLSMLIIISLWAVGATIVALIMYRKRLVD